MTNELKKEFNVYLETTEVQQSQLRELISNELLKEKDALEKHEYYETIRKASVVADNYHFPEPIYAHQVLDAFLKVANIMGNDNPMTKEVMVVGDEMRKAYDYSKNKPERLKLLLQLEANVKICWKEDFHKRIDFFRNLNYGGATLGCKVIKKIQRIIDNAKE